MFETFHFIRPQLLLLFIPLVTLCCLIFRLRVKRHKQYSFMDAHLAPHLTVKAHDQKSKITPIWAYLLTTSFAVIAVAGPAWQRQASPFVEDLSPLMVVLEVSHSMDAKDLLPSRLDRAKIKIRELLNARGGSSTGLIVYSGSSHLVMPMTKDSYIIGQIAESIVTGIMPKEGDSVDQALLLAQRMIAQSGLPASIVIIADELPAVRDPEKFVRQFTVPTQLLHIKSSSANDNISKTMSRKLGFDYVGMTIDNQDVGTLVKGAERSTVMTYSGDGNRWRDMGYVLIFPIALIALLWMRQGWKLVDRWGV